MTRLRPLYYFSEQFPCLSQTFTLAEVRGLVEEGFAPTVVSLHPPGPGDPPLDSQRDPPVWTLPLPFGAATLAASARALAVHPVTTLGLAAACAVPHTTPFDLRYQLRAPLHLAWASLVARRLPAGAHLHAQFCGAASNVAWMAARLAGATFSFTAHADHGLPFVAAKLRAARFVTAISEVEKARILAEAPDVPPNRVRVVRVGIDAAAWAAPRAARPRDRPLHVVAVGMVGPTKGHELLVEAAALLRTRGVPMRLDIVGDGAGKAGLEAAVVRHGLGDVVHLLGARPHAEVRDLVRRCDVVALACRVTPTGDVDGIPVALMEGMAAGKAVVSCPVGAIPELVTDGVTGLLVPPDRPDALAASFERLAADDDLRLRLGEAGRGRIEAGFDARASRRAMAELFATALGDAHES